MTLKLTKRTIDAMKAPQRGSRLIRDSEVAGFGIRIQAPTSRTPQGKRTFYFNFHCDGFEHRITIGAYPTWTCEAARDRAKELRRAVDRGENPAVEKRERREAPTILDLAERYKRDHLPSKCERAQVEDWRTIETRILPRLGNHKVADVNHSDCAALHKYVTKHHGPIRANRVIAVLSRMFTLAMLPDEGEGHVAWVNANPCRFVERNEENQCERFFSPAELARIAEALSTYPNQTAADACRLTMLTGARPGETCKAKWTEFDKEPGNWVKPSAHTKQRKDHRVPLSPPALELIDRRRRNGSEYVFPSHGSHIKNLRKVWAHVRKTSGVSGRCYDLRHSLASVAAAGGASLIVIGKLLGHTNPKTTQRYVHLTEDFLRETANRVGAVIAPTHTAVVLPIKRSMA